MQAAQVTDLKEGEGEPVVPLDELRRFTETVFAAAGLREGDAATVADSLVTADLRGTHSHGVVRLPFLVERLLRGGARATARPKLVSEAGATALVDGDQALGAVTAAHAMELAIGKAREQGVGLVAARNSDFIGTCAHYAMMALPHDMIGIAWTNGFPGMAPWGGRRNTIGNNPIAFAAPSERSGPIVLDMALSVAAGGRIRLAAKSGEAIPGGWLVDQGGMPTTDPAALSRGGALLPLGYKGYGLAVFGEILCGVLSGSRILGEIPAWFAETARATGNGHLHVAIDIARFVEPAAFRRRVDEMVALLKATPLVPGASEILLPGERAWRTQQRQQAHGIAISATTLQDLRSLGHKLAVPLPAGLA